MAFSPDATSTEGPLSVALVAPKKKRVRRQQVELKQLRELTQKLELRLDQLKKRRVASKACNDNPNGDNKMKHGSVSVWKTIADRQFKERSRAEKQNEELKVMVRTQLDKVKTLQTRLHKVSRDMQQQAELTKVQLQNDRYWDFEFGDEEGLFADLLTLVVNTHLEIQQHRVEGPRSALSFTTWGISLGEPHVREDSEAGFVMETHGWSLLPFNVNTTAAACWKMFSLSPMKHALTVNDTINSDVLAQSFICSSTHFGQKVSLLGKHTCRRYVGEDGCITIVFAVRSGPATALTPCQDVQLQKSGWIKVRQLDMKDRNQQTSALIECHTETLPCFRNGSTGQEEQAREVIDWASKSHLLASEWYRHTLSDVLVEEDWKTFRGGEDGVSA